MQLIIPAYNEEARLPGTIAALRAHTLGARESVSPVEVIVVDNASSDDTAGVARRLDSPAMRVRVIHCDIRGKGAAVRAGMQATTASVVGFMDADCATDLAALEAAMRHLDAGADVAIGSRAVEGSETMQRHSQVRSHGAALYRRLTNKIAPGIADTQCGFKLMRGDVARSAFESLRTKGFSFDVELLARLQDAGARIVEFPVTWIDMPGSTFVPARHGVMSFVELARIAGYVRPLDRRFGRVVTLEKAPQIFAPSASVLSTGAALPTITEA
ncbi:glycosyltransferase [Nocardioides sp. Root151]|uniref:glycosyltransferase n=1 Tax=Nocardioides sp. Root151 TaxID=1736475 RepID=UPI0007038589|nr:glycosyltransferase [Nocardioides sp. Root151]KQZ69960.1 hypothetical protein ASD66_09720 [Nocardioides sp. Root151]